jgi:hypothetical protein
MIERRYYFDLGKAPSKAPRRVLWSTLILGLLLAAPAKAGLLGYYALGNWTLTNTPFTDGFVTSPDDGLSMIITGGNSGSGLPGTTDFFISALAAGIVRFDYSYSSLDVLPPGCDPVACDDAGTLLNGVFTLRADDLQQRFGTAIFSVRQGDLFGFRVETADNSGEPGVLAISNFSAPVPEPGNLPIVMVATIAAIWAGRRKTKALTPSAERGCPQVHAG